MKGDIKLGRGRNPEPVDLILAKGKSHHITKEGLEKRRSTEVKAKSDCILVPEFVPEDLHDRFLFISGQLQDIGIMSNLDVDCLGRYVVTQHQWELAFEGLQKMSPYKKVEKELLPNEDYDKMLTIVNKLQKQVKSEASGLGLSISDRCKLVIPKVDKPEAKKVDPFDMLFGGGGS